MARCAGGGRSMKFQEIKNIVVAADKQALDDWNAKYGWGARPGIEDLLGFIEFRRNQLAGAVVMILTELIAREEKEA